MREAAVPGYRLSRAKYSTRVLITLGLIGLLSGLLFAAALTLLKTGIMPDSVRTYYLGSETPGDSVDALLSSSARPLSELAEVTHLHLMGGSMLLFFLCHLLALCDIPDSTRTTIYCIAFGSFLLTFGSPWIIVFATPLGAYLFGPAIVLFICSLLLCTIIPLYEMWLRPA